jgi:hypothetical protein
MFSGAAKSDRPTLNAERKWCGPGCISSNAHHGVDARKLRRLPSSEIYDRTAT